MSILSRTWYNRRSLLAVAFIAGCLLATIPLSIASAQTGQPPTPAPATPTAPPPPPLVAPLTATMTGTTGTPAPVATAAPVTTPSGTPIVTGSATPLPNPTNGVLVIANGSGLSSGSVLAADGVTGYGVSIIPSRPSATSTPAPGATATPAPSPVIVNIAPTAAPTSTAYTLWTPPPAGETATALPTPAPGETSKPVVMAAYNVDVHNYDPTTKTVGEKNTTTTVRLNLPVDDQTLRAIQSMPSDQQLQIVRQKSDGSWEQIDVTFLPGPPAYLQTDAFVPASLYMIAFTPRTVPADTRYFKETGFRVNNDSFWDYFNKRGGLRTFGYPVSREFNFLGSEVQFFQRGVLQQTAGGGVARLNMLGEGLLPYTQINGSSFPAPDQDLIKAAPSLADADYAEKAIAFVEANVPDTWNGQKVGFLSAFKSTVGSKDAFPTGGGNDALLPLFNMEIWGLPTSKPVADPNNKDFVYQRFQRGILHYDASNGTTQGLLLADYLKSLITGRDLPIDLETQASGSRLLRQLDPSKPGMVKNLPGTLLNGAFDKETVK